MAETEIKRVIKIESSESLNTLNNLSSRIKELKENMGDLDITTDEYRQVSEEVTQLENVKRNAIRGVTAAVEGSYNAYSKELSILQKHRKTLNENTQEYRDMTKRVAELQQKLKDMDADVGVYSRNVGNYSSAFDGLQGSVDNAAKKLPQLSSGFAGFAAAMVEDIPKIIAQLQAMTAAEEGAAVANETMAVTGELAGMANTTVGATATANAFLNPSTIKIMVMGVVAFGVASACGVLFAKLMNCFLKEGNKINPLIGSAGVSAVPMAARVSQKVGQEENPSNFLLMHAMGPNVAGVVGSAVAAGLLLSFLG